MYMPSHYIKKYHAGQKKKMEIYELNATKQKSYYGKALVIDEKDILKLQSYTTIVAYLDKKLNQLHVSGWYSMTTSKHVNDFAKMCGYEKGLSKKEIEGGLVIQL